MPLCKEGMWLLIWPLDGIHRKTGKSYMIHIPFSTLIFLHADVVHAGCFSKLGNICLHCAFKDAGNPSGNTFLLPLDELLSIRNVGDLLQTVYSLCWEPEEQDYLPSFSVINDQAINYFREKYFMAQFNKVCEWRRPINRRPLYKRIKIRNISALHQIVYGTKSSIKPAIRTKSRKK